MAGAITWEYVANPSVDEIQQFIQMAIDGVTKKLDLLSEQEQEKLMEAHMILAAYTQFQLHRGKTEQDMTDFFVEKGVSPYIVQFIMRMTKEKGMKTDTKFTYAANALLCACRHMPDAFFSEENLCTFTMAGLQRIFKDSIRMHKEGVPDLQILNGVMWHQIPPELDVTHELPSGNDVWEATSVDKLNFYADAFVVICARVTAYIGYGLSPAQVIEYLIAERIPTDIAEKIVNHVVPNLAGEAYDSLLQVTPKRKRTILIVCLIVLIMFLVFLWK